MVLFNFPDQNNSAIYLKIPITLVNNLLQSRRLAVLILSSHLKIMENYLFFVISLTFRKKCKTFHFYYLFPNKNFIIQSSLILVLNFKVWNNYVFIRCFCISVASCKLQNDESCQCSLKLSGLHNLTSKNVIIKVIKISIYPLFRGQILNSW